MVGLGIEQKSVVDLDSPYLGSIGGQLHLVALFLSSSLPSQHVPTKYMTVLSDLELLPRDSVKIVAGVESHVVTAQASHLSTSILSVQDSNSGYTTEEDTITTEEGDDSVFLAYAIAGNTTVMTVACSFKLGDQRLGWNGGIVDFQLLIDPPHSWVVHVQARPPENAIGEASAWIVEVSCRSQS
ncbi:hypothetical protein HanXRQr2_Chr05g0217641 [Helianthus annuus]|uniref:Uncharacterized protein n=1 Tax=Helianthus annuus TaxID=4232 RepID=A0A9K3IZL0_HELAN|nr:hypothetical protein HanXRQr2_Chr05g0217641 [Helianthus annuus]